jgi:hypothetical protein
MTNKNVFVFISNSPGLQMIRVNETWRTALVGPRIERDPGANDKDVLNRAAMFCDYVPNLSLIQLNR